MASGIYTAGTTARWKGDVDTDSHTIKCALMNNSHTFNVDHDGWSDVSANEISGTGYTAGGATLASVTATSDDTNNRFVLDAADPAWTTATFTAYHAVIYDDSHASKVLIASIDFGGAKTVTAGTFTIQIHANGILTEA